MSFSLNVSTVLSAIQGGSLLSVLNSALSPTYRITYNTVDKSLLTAAAGQEVFSPSGWDASPSAAGSTYFPQFSAKAPSAPQIGHSAFIVSSVQAISQVHTAVSSMLSSAKAVVGIRQSTMH